MEDFRPAEVFPPGEYLQDALGERGWTQTEFAEIIGRPTRVVNEIIAGRRSISPETAREIAAGLGTSAQYWLNLESAYQLSKVPEPDSRIAREATLRARFPVRELVKRGWVKSAPDFDSLERSVLSFFEIKAVNDDIRFSRAARRSYTDKTELQWAWIFRVKQLAGHLQVPTYSKQKLAGALNDLEALMGAPEEVRHVPKILAACGVRFVVVEPIPGSAIHGVCFWLDSKSPVIGLTLKWDFIDRFWFTLRHEIEHVLNEDAKNDPIADSFDENDKENEEECEKLANTAAQEFCVPQVSLSNFVARHHPMYSVANFVGFCRLMKRHPGIVAGQLQRRVDNRALFKKFQARVRDILIQSALTDGYGKSGPI
jgi:HTH-type transcriptional regulator/antitoxin HigA